MDVKLINPNISYFKQSVSDTIMWIFYVIISHLLFMCYHNGILSYIPSYISIQTDLTYKPFLLHSILQINRYVCLPLYNNFFDSLLKQTKYTEKIIEPFFH